MKILWAATKKGAAGKQTKKYTRDTIPLLLRSLSTIAFYPFTFSTFIA